jgi:P4 family phage/plasmid primase-like protien
MNYEKVDYDDKAFAFMMQKFPDSKKQGGDRYLATCPACGHKAKFWWAEKMPHFGGCHACDHKVNSVFDLGYRSENKGKVLSDLSKIENLVLFYQNKSQKKHRLSQKVVNEFNLQSLQFQKKNGYGFYHNIGIPDNATLGCIKHLNYDGRWISVPSKFRNDRKWLNIERTKPTDEYVFVLAGEWDMFAFWEHTGMHGISPVDGETSVGKYPGQYYDIFSNKKVVILFDNDPAGRAGAKSLARAIQKRVKTKWVKAPDMSRLGMEGGEDLDDFFVGGGTKERLWEEIKATPDFKPDLSDDEIELQRIEEAFKRPENINSTLEPELLDKIWKTLLLPEAKRKMILTEILESQGFFRSNDAVSFRDEYGKYINELNTLRYAAYDDLIKDWFEEYHIKKATRHSEMSDSLYYYYEDGFYQFLSPEFIMQSSDTIARKITAPDERMILSRTRKQANEDINIKLLESIETSFDHHKDYINFSNGTYLLAEKKLVGHSPEFLLNYKLPIQYDPAQDCPSFKEALGDWTHNAEDKRELLKALYYLISGDRSKSIVLWLHGDGNDGKGEFVQLCKALVGEKRTSSLAIETIEKTHYTIELYNKMLNIADEVPKNFIIPDAMFKRISGNSVITGDPKYKGLISFVSRALWIIPSNHFPNVADTSHGYFRRFKIFQFKKIPKSKEIGHFFENKLKPELSGIINLILTEGREYYETEGFVKTKSELESTAEMKEKNTAFLYWNSTMSAWEHMVDEQIEHFRGSADWSSFEDPEKMIRVRALNEVVKLYEDLSQAEELDVLQKYSSKEGMKWLINPSAHYKFYRDFFKNDEVRLLSLSNFRASTINFFKDYWQERTIEKIRIWSKEPGSDTKKNVTYLWVKAEGEK